MGRAAHIVKQGGGEAATSRPATPKDRCSARASRPQRICALADELGAGAIVMGADQSSGGLIGGMMWTQEPQRVERRANVLVAPAIDASPTP